MKITLLATHFNIYLNLEASLHSIITVICINPYSPNKLIATKYCFLILGDDTSFFFLIFFCYFTLLLIFTKIILFLIFFSMKIIFIFSCSGMFRNVPCSMFYRRLTHSPSCTTFGMHVNRIMKDCVIVGLKLKKKRKK